MAPLGVVEVGQLYTFILGGPWVGFPGCLTGPIAEREDRAERPRPKEAALILFPQVALTPRNA